MIYTDMNTDGFTSDELAILNGAYDHIILSVDPAFEVETKAPRESVIGAWVPGDTVDTLVARVLENHPSLAGGERK